MDAGVSAQSSELVGGRWRVGAVVGAGGWTPAPEKQKEATLLVPASLAGCRVAAVVRRVVRSKSEPALTSNCRLLC